MSAALEVAVERRQTANGNGWVYKAVFHPSLGVSKTFYGLQHKGEYPINWEPLDVFRELTEINRHFLTLEVERVHNGGLTEEEVFQNRCKERAKHYRILFEGAREEPDGM